MTTAPQLVERDPEVVLSAFLRELLADPELTGLTSLLPRDRELTMIDALPLVPVVMAQLRTPASQLRVVDRAARAYLRAADLHVSEE